MIFLLIHDPVWSFNWTVSPSLTVQEVFTDNINLTNINQESALTTDLSPGLSINGNSAISSFDFNYKLQAQYNAGGTSGIDLNNQLQMNTLYTLVENRLFIDSSSSISQQNVSNRRITNSNVSGGNNSTNVSTFRLSPSWTPHFKNYADGDFRVSYDRVTTDGGNSSLSDSNTYTQNFNLTSGSYFSYVSWLLSFNNSNRRNEGGVDIDTQSSLAEIRYAIGSEFTFFANLQQSSNSFLSNSNNNNNGIAYTFGARWQPSHRFALDVGLGNNYFVTVEISPFRRLRWKTTYTKKDIGLNTGDVWNSQLDYSTKRSVWSFSYSEDTTTTQQLLLNQQVFTLVDQFGNPQSNVVTNQSPGFNQNLPSLTDEVFVVKTANLSVSYRTGRSNVSASIFRTIRDFEQSLTEEEVTGVSGSWNWNYFKRTNFTISSSWQQTESNGASAFSDQLFNLSVAVTRNIFSRLNGSIIYRYVDQNSDDDLNTYTENRISASLTLQF